MIINCYNVRACSRNKGKYFRQAAKIRRLIQKDFEEMFIQQEFDALLVPSTNHSAPTIRQVQTRSAEEDRKDDFFTQSANMCGRLFSKILQ